METDTKTRIKRPRIDNKAFVAAWIEVFNKGGTQQDVAEMVGCSLPGLLNKMKKLEKEGVVLPDLSKAKRKSGIDADGLNSFIQANLKK
jgi:CRP-like cAMP-binding protein